MLTRREFLSLPAGSAVWFAASSQAAQTRYRTDRKQGAKRVKASHLPRWRGFNLLEKFVAEQNAPFLESDFEWMAEWGFDFVRLPLSYRCWAEPDPVRWFDLKESVLKEIDQAVEFGRKYGIHVNLNFHRGPGYCVNPPKEPLDLWRDERALEACAFHWAHFAQRYKGLPNTRVSFDLLNEPGLIAEASYVRVVKRLVEAIREEDPGRLIIADGLLWGRDPVEGLVGLGIAQSTRGYDPMQISHYKASWIGGSDKWPEPTWPLQTSPTDVWNKDRLLKERIAPWKALERKGVGIHVGEWGAFQHTPHPVVLDWMRDCLQLWKEAGWGWALWNFRGSFGILDSGRADVQYEDFHGHKLDRAMLELLQGM
ncbi:MAG: cellulase family glycosylhydrolase [Armatimonadetes bacterium]|nr:cellulase family glycosylhydrolase [Armatimonadota bacterium]